MVEILVEIFHPVMLLVIIGGLALGNFVGAVPGLTATMALIVLLPFAVHLPIAQALLFLSSIYIGAMRGGGITAILINIPGTPADIATCFDGYPMAKRGLAREALMMSIFASVMGGLIGTVLLWVAVLPLARVALTFGPPELFWLTVVGISLIVSLSGGSLIKGLISGFVGLMMTTVGGAPVDGSMRFTFGLPLLAGGVNMLAGMIGLYAVPRIIELVQEAGQSKKEIFKISGNIHGIMLKIIKEWFSNKAGLVAGLVGCFIGILPGAGSSIAGLMAYDQVKRMDKHPENFGKGEIKGVTASETANNAVCSTSLIPTLAFGIPGSPPAAVILGALLVLGLLPGHRLFIEHAFMVNTFIAGLFLANILLLPVGMYTSNLFSRALYLPKATLAAMIAVFSVVGAFAIRGLISDVFVIGIIGVVMYFASRIGFSPAPAVIGLVLGTMAEQGFAQSVMLARPHGGLIPYFVGRPITVVLMIIVVLLLTVPYLKEYLKGRSKIQE